MRVIAGTAGGTTLSVPKGGARPTTDRVREALFAILDPLLAGAHVLDLYAGSGALGIEALSRGAASATFLDHSREACRVIAENLRRAGLPGGGVTCSEVLPALRRRGLARRFDLILADPPYAKDDPGGGEAAALLASGLIPPLLAPGGYLVLERPATNRPETPDTPGLQLAETREYGSTALDFYRPSGTS